MNNKPILFEDKMKYRDNEFLYDKCIKQHDCIINYQWKMREYKDKLKEKDKEIERLKIKCDNETFSEAYYYGHHKDLEQRIDIAIEYINDDLKDYKTISYCSANELLKILKGSDSK